METVQVESNKELKKVTAPATKKFGGWIWIGGETLTWNRVCAVVGAISGLLISVAVLLWLNLNSNVESINTLSTPVPLAPDYSLAIYIIPIFGFILGGFAGILVGNGIPKYNPDPEQGRWARLKILKRFKTTKI